ncbi:MAG: hypothetical protein ACTHJK_06440 [Sphingomicrobium sp.]|jgi:hypothetical protein
MFRKILLAGAALATLSVPAAADAQYYGRSYGTYGHGRHYYWDGHHYRDRNNNAIVDALIGGVLGYAIGAASAGSYAYGYPSYGYSYPSYGYGYSNYYSYPSYGYGSYYSYPNYSYRYGYRYCGYYRC